jgi:DNA polymerase-3 subunit delta'
MSLFTDIIGHKDQCAYLERVAALDALSHAYVFSGPAHLGKKTIARQLVSQFKNVNTIGRPLDEKTGLYKKTIPVESIRDLRADLQLSSFDGGKKVAIITDADTMTIAAQNALLKTLEEPKGDTILILIATKADSLLETIRSRSVHLRFRPVARQDIQDAVKDEELAGFAAGRPGIALGLLDEETKNAFTEKLDQAKLFLTNSFAKRVKVIELAVKEKDANHLKQTIQAWRQVTHDCFLISSSHQPQLNQGGELESFAKSKTPAQWASALHALGVAEDSISKNANANIALEQFAIQLGL